LREKTRVPTSIGWLEKRKKEDPKGNYVEVSAKGTGG